MTRHEAMRIAKGRIKTIRIRGGYYGMIVSSDEAILAATQVLESEAAVKAQALRLMEMAHEIAEMARDDFRE